MSSTNVPNLPWALPLYEEMRKSLQLKIDDNSLPVSLQIAVDASMRKLTTITLQRRTISMSLQQVEPLNFFFFKKKSNIPPSLSLFTVPVVVQCSWQGCLREGQNSVSTCH